MNNTTFDKPENFLQTKKALQIYQLDRIERTYRDFSNSLQFKELTSFFFEQIYGPQDFGFRNDTIKSLFNKSQFFLNKEIAIAVDKVIELNDLSDELDDLVTKQMGKIGIKKDINPINYAKAYKSCDNYKQRCYQIDLIVEATDRVFKLSRVWLVRFSLTGLHSFASLLGMGKIMNFLYDGYRAFQSVDDISPFINAVHSRETNLNNKLFGILVK